MSTVVGKMKCCVILLVALATSVLSSASAEQIACDTRVGGASSTISFGSFQATLNSAADSNRDGTVTVCILQGPSISNTAATQGALVIPRNDITIAGVTTTNALSGCLDDATCATFLGRDSALTEAEASIFLVNKTNFRLLGSRLFPQGLNGNGISVQNGGELALLDSSVLMPRAGHGIVLSQYGRIVQVSRSRFEMANGAAGIATVGRGGEIEMIRNTAFNGSKVSAPGMMLAGTSVGLLDGVFVVGPGVLLTDGSHVFKIRNIKGGGVSYAVSVNDSTVDTIADSTLDLASGVGITCGGGDPIIGSRIGTVSNVTIDTGTGGYGVRTRALSIGAACEIGVIDGLKTTGKGDGIVVGGLIHLLTDSQLVTTTAMSYDLRLSGGWIQALVNTTLNYAGDSPVDDRSRVIRAVKVIEQKGTTMTKFNARKGRRNRRPGRRGRSSY